MNDGTKRRILRNLIIFAIVALGVGWFGVWLDTQVVMKDTGGTLGMSVWLVLPLLTVIVLRTLGKDGWADFGLKPMFKSSWPWYIVAILIYPVTIGVTLGLGMLIGATSLMGNGLAAFIPLVVAAFVANMVKNIFEEFSWRGYLTPRFDALGIHPFLNHVLTGVVWAGWHIPYWIYFVSKAEMQSYTLYSLPLYIVIGCVTTVIIAVAYGELRLISKSVWPGYIMHTAGNAIVLILLTKGFIAVQRGWYFLLNPSLDGVLMLIVFAAFGVMTYRIRKKNKRGD